MQFNIRHTNINIQDMERSVDFYREALGLTVSRVKNRRRQFSAHISDRCLGTI